jgi:TusA-related sulfurtransferase
MKEPTTRTARKLLPVPDGEDIWLIYDQTESTRNVEIVANENSARNMALQRAAKIKDGRPVYLFSLADIAQLQPSFAVFKPEGNAEPTT